MSGKKNGRKPGKEEKVKKLIELAKEGKLEFEKIAKSREKRLPYEKRLFRDIIEYSKTVQKPMIISINHIKKGYRNEEFMELLDFVQSNSIKINDIEIKDGAIVLSNRIIILEYDGHRYVKIIPY